MAKWEIRIAYRDRDEPLVTASQRSLPPEDRATARSLILRLATDGCGTVGQALDRLEAADSAERRRLLDDARAAAGLPSISIVEAREQVQTLNRTAVVKGPLRDSRGRIAAICSAPSARTSRRTRRLAGSPTSP